MTVLRLRRINIPRLVRSGLLAMIKVLGVMSLLMSYFGKLHLNLKSQETKGYRV